MKGPFLYCALSLAMLTKNNSLPGFVYPILVIILIVSGIMSIVQFGEWISKKMAPTVAQRNQAARDRQTKFPVIPDRNGPTPAT